MAARAEDLLPVEYFHVVFTLPAEIARIAYWNRKTVYGLLFKASAETVTTIAADPRRLGARTGMTSVLHTWGSALTHHPHVHMIVPGGGLSLDGTRWMACRPGFFLAVRVLSRLFRRLFLEGLAAGHRAGKLIVFGELAGLRRTDAFASYLAPLRKSEWVVDAKPPFGGAEAVLACLGRYTHRVAISNRRLISTDVRTAAFRWKDYRVKPGDRPMTMCLATNEFIRRFLIHVLPDDFHRIRHYGLLASAGRSQYREAPRLARRGTGQAGKPANRRDHRAQTSGAMPRLRRPDAHHRDIPPRRAPFDTRTTNEAGSMMKRPSLHQNRILKRPSFRVGLDLCSAATNTLKWFETTAKNTDKCWRITPKPILAMSTKPWLSPQTTSTGTTLVMLCP